MKTTTSIIWLLIIASFVAGIFFYPSMPEKMASHWGINGEVDGYMPKLLCLFLMPAITLLMLILFLIIPKIDPLKKNIQKFRKTFDIFILIIILFMLFMHGLVIAANLGFKFNMNHMMPPALGILFYYAGILIQSSKRNWFIGIRTPWTMSNDKVWDKTHRLGSRLFKAAGIITVFSVLIPQYSFWIMMASIIPAAFIPIVYSYVVYNRLKRK